ncbi:MAG TPA: TetR/AcrR family transcriptional regulator [Puia sp.]|jgi:AcrR family transcriptional regulator|nr:TetR/AcrR family transcriptional regulator [Puia sp.]
MKPVVVVDKIMDTADRLFYEQGFNLTGINQIIEEAGISKPSLYNHFRSKNDLLLAYLDQLYTKWFAGLDAFSEDFNSPLDKVMALFDYRINRQITTQYKGCAWNKIANEVAPKDYEVFERVSKFKADLKIRITNLVRQLNRPIDKLLTDEDLVEVIFSQLESGVLMAHATKSHQSLENGKNIVRKLV